MRDVILKLKEERRKIEENPDYEIAATTKRLRQKSFKANHNNRKNKRLILSLTNATEAIEATPLQVVYPTDSSNYEEMATTEAIEATPLNVVYPIGS